MIVVHHLERSRSHRVLWMLEELGLPYELVTYQRDPQTILAPPALRAIHPLGKSPVITDDGIAIAESGAILEYLVERHGGGRLAPAVGTPAHLRYRYFLHYAEGSLMPPLLVKLIASKIATAKMPFFARPIARKIAGSIESSFVDPNLTRHLAFLEAELTGRTWFAGDELTASRGVFMILRATSSTVPSPPTTTIRSKPSSCTPDKRRVCTTCRPAALSVVRTCCRADTVSS